MNAEYSYLLMDYLKMLLKLSEEGFNCKDKIGQAIDKLHKEMGLHTANVENLKININTTNINKDQQVNDIVDDIMKGLKSMEKPSIIYNTEKFDDCNKNKSVFDIFE